MKIKIHEVFETRIGYADYLDSYPVRKAYIAELQKERKAAQKTRPGLPDIPDAEKPRSEKEWIENQGSVEGRVFERCCSYTLTFDDEVEEPAEGEAPAKPRPPISVDERARHKALYGWTKTTDKESIAIATAALIARFTEPETKEA